jgi:hypothetical protein
VTKTTANYPLSWPGISQVGPVDSTASWAKAWRIALSPLSCAQVSTNKGTSVTALQDWLNIRPFDPRDHVKALIGAFRGDSAEDAGDDIAEPVLIRRGVERC